MGRSVCNLFGHSWSSLSVGELINRSVGAIFGFVVVVRWVSRFVGWFVCWMVARWAWSLFCCELGLCFVPWLSDRSIVRLAVLIDLLVAWSVGRSLAWSVR